MQVDKGNPWGKTGFLEQNWIFGAKLDFSAASSWNVMCKELVVNFLVEKLILSSQKKEKLSAKKYITILKGLKIHPPAQPRHSAIVAVFKNIQGIDDMTLQIENPKKSTLKKLLMSKVVRYKINTKLKSFSIYLR